MDPVKYRANNSRENSNKANTTTVSELLSPKFSPSFITSNFIFPVYLHCKARTDSFYPRTRYFTIFIPPKVYFIFLRSLGSTPKRYPFGFRCPRTVERNFFLFPENDSFSARYPRRIAFLHRKYIMNCTRLRALVRDAFGLITFRPNSLRTAFSLVLSVMHCYTIRNIISL